MYTIYALLCPVTKDVRYVGYTKHPLKKRLSAHYGDSKVKGKTHTHKARWLSALKQKAIIVPIETEIPNIEYALAREVFWISRYSRLTNSTTGGENGKEFTHEVRKKISETKKRKFASGETVNFFKGKKNPTASKLCREAVWNAERRKKVSEARKRYIAKDTGNHKARAAQRCKAVKMSTLEGQLVKVWVSIRTAHNEGYDRAAISRCCKGKNKYHKGFKWEFA